MSKHHQHPSTPIIDESISLISIKKKCNFYGNRFKRLPSNSAQFYIFQKKHSLA
jgi:hypothetical protein